MPRVLVLGTFNRKKGTELAELLAPHGFDLRTLSDYDNPLLIAETGGTFAANALLKATHQARHLGEWVVGEDSGLEVDALDGAPGVYSARFAGEDADDNRNNQKLLEAMSGIPVERRNARFVCHVALSDPEGRVRISCEDHCRGRIRYEPVGENGFGYDPLFEVVEYHKTFGELGNTVKSVISHRSRALRRFIPMLDGLITGGQWSNQ